MTSFANDIRPLFRDADRNCMLQVKMPDGVPLDLHDRDAVAHHAATILLEVAAGKMPMGGPEWDRAQVKLFALWIDDRCPA